MCVTVDSAELSVPAENQTPLSASLQADLIPVRRGSGVGGGLRLL